jgi:hypothetical protein
MNEAECLKHADLSRGSERLHFSACQSRLLMSSNQGRLSLLGGHAPVHAGRDVLREKSEGPFGGVFPRAQKHQNPHKAGFGGASFAGVI